MLKIGFLVNGGAKGDRTPDLDNAIVALSQLSYGPTRWSRGKWPIWAGKTRLFPKRLGVLFFQGRFPDRLTQDFLPDRKCRCIKPKHRKVL